MRIGRIGMAMSTIAVMLCAALPVAAAGTFEAELDAPPLVERAGSFMQEWTTKPAE